MVVGPAQLILFPMCEQHLFFFLSLWHCEASFGPVNDIHVDFLSISAQADRVLINYTSSRYLGTWVNLQAALQPPQLWFPS